MIDRIDLDHVAVAVERHAHAWPRYAGDLAGAWLSGGTTFGFAPAQLRYGNGMRLEVLEPHAVHHNDFLRRFLDRSGPGPHHLTFKVGDIGDTLSALDAANITPVGVDLSDPQWKEAFLHPKTAHGVVVQLAQSGGDWVSPPPDDLPAPRVDRPATLDRVAHAVPSLDDALELFAGVLGGREIGRDADEHARWVDLAWPGPGRLRLLAPAAASSPVAGWLGGRPGRIHHLAFTADDPAGVDGARQVDDVTWEVDPERNLGVRLVLRAA